MGSKVKALCLLSGGLDSSLAMKLVLDQGVEVIAVNFVGPFCQCSRGSCDGSPASKVAKSLGVRLVVLRMGEDYLEIVRNPKHGYGSNMNPCIDCRIYMVRKAKELMEKEGASFIVTGEVLGQRPMSQRMDAMRKIEKESNLEGLILRPLSAKVLPPTIPETRGWVDREKLLGISGRSRKEQMKLARDWALKGHSCPAGGCLLTDPGFSKRIKDLIEHDSLSLREIGLLRIGRHFRLPQGSKLIVGRNEAENRVLSERVTEGDICIVTDGCPGPTAILRGEKAREEVRLAAGVVARYSDCKDSPSVRMKIKRGSTWESITVKPLSPENVNQLMI